MDKASRRHSARMLVAALRMLVAALGLIVVGLVGVAGPASAGGYYTSYNPCPYDRPYQHCNAFGSCYCSRYP